jgi:hypothetical protein
MLPGAATSGMWVLSFPYELFEGVFEEIAPELKKRWEQRSRPLPRSVDYAMKHFERVWAVDGSVLEALFRKLDSLRDCPAGQLAGKICTVIELGSQLPVQVWFTENAKAHDCHFLQNLLDLVTPHTLLILDRGFYDFEWWSKLIAKGTQFISAAKSNLVYTVIKDLSLTHHLKNRLIEIGTDNQGNPLVQLRLIEIRKGNGWYRYLTSVLEPEILPPYVIADLYARRWRIEYAFHIVKRLLGLSYLWTGSLNGIKLQIWATWLMYAVLVDLSDAVAEAVQLPLERISPEMVWRGLYHFNHAYNTGHATDPVAYLAAPENRDLGVIKTIRKPPRQLDFTPYFSAFSCSSLQKHFLLNLLPIGSDRLALGIWLITTIAAAVLVGYLYAGKSWCQYFCPMAPVQMVFTGPRGLLGSQAHWQKEKGLTQSTCREVDPKTQQEKSACVGCKSPCMDIDAERSYWDRIVKDDQKFILYGYLGLVFGFYVYYFL